MTRSLHTHEIVSESPGAGLSRTLTSISSAHTTELMHYPRFATKVVNRWYHRHTLLIGDAAHVFPPFGGQGIASGIRDAQSLSWRLAFLSRLSVTKSVQEKFLTGWAHERRQATDHAMLATKTNGQITNQRGGMMALISRTVAGWLWMIPGIPATITKFAMGDMFRYQLCEGGFLLSEKNGGRKLPQIWLRKGGSGPVLSDTVFIQDMSHLALVVIVRESDETNDSRVAKSIQNAALPSQILNGKGITFLLLGNQGLTLQCRQESNRPLYRPCGAAELLKEGIKPIDGYDEKTLERRIGRSARFVVVRPDFYIHSVASDEGELVENLGEIVQYFK